MASVLLRSLIRTSRTATEPRAQKHSYKKRDAASVLEFEESSTAYSILKFRNGGLLWISAASEYIVGHFSLRHIR
jgi:hypothetical protein